MKILLTNENVFNIVYVLKTDYPDLSKYDKRFNFAVSRNILNLQPIAAELLKAREPGIERFKDFEQKKEDIIRKYAILDERGNPIILNDVIQFSSEEEKEKGQLEVNNLIEEYRDALNERQKEIDIYNEILRQDVEVDIVQCSFNALPDNFNFDVLRCLVKETDEEIEGLL